MKGFEQGVEVTGFVCSDDLGDLLGGFDSGPVKRNQRPELDWGTGSERRGCV